MYYITLTHIALATVDLRDKLYFLQSLAALSLHEERHIDLAVS